ncbi:RNA polymerase sigma factor [Chondrinema litorale]|uniref:RNA polymerase sigma factor n=1 Tax=Chondrinema litorale TaxID=2994555 RepID=UPI002543580B|nr:sigma-70 family RNA polymerase sigma factor [Chondrinema litorale]UZR97289.1 sigma-70 family RNA polymerase sigma factor [Chondrinema litorale]
MKSRSGNYRNSSESLVSEKKFAEIYNQHYDSLYVFLLRKTSDKRLTEELAYEAFLKLWNKLQENCEIENTKAYLLGIAKNLLYDYYLKKNRFTSHHVFLDQLPDRQSNNLTPEEQTLNDELKQHLDRAIDNLSPQSALIFKMVRVNGLKYKEVAEQLGISVSSVDTQLSRAIKKLRKILSSYRQNKSEIRKHVIEKLTLVLLLLIFF